MQTVTNTSAQQRASLRAGSTLLSSPLHFLSFLPSSTTVGGVLRGSELIGRDGELRLSEGVIESAGPAHALRRTSRPSHIVAS